MDDEGISILLGPIRDPRRRTLDFPQATLDVFGFFSSKGRSAFDTNIFFNECFLCTMNNKHIILFNPSHPQIRYYHLYFLNGDSVRLSIISKLTQFIRGRSRISTKTFSFLPTFHCSGEKRINV